ncbi:MAG: acyl-CoA dehydrogenase family protein [Anaerolineales bacterium]
MYSFDPTEEQQMLMDAVKKYAENDLRPAAHEAEETSELPKQPSAKAGSSDSCKRPSLNPMAGSASGAR